MVVVIAFIRTKIKLEFITKDLKFIIIITKEFLKKSVNYFIKIFLQFAAIYVSNKSQTAFIYKLKYF